MVVKFIVVCEDAGGCKKYKRYKIVFGDKYYTDDYHADIADKAGIPYKKVCGGGIADLEEKHIWGTSKKFGPYNPEILKKLLPDWTIDEPSDY